MVEPSVDGGLEGGVAGRGWAVVNFCSMTLDVVLLIILAGTAELIDSKVGARFFATRTGDPSASLFRKKAEFTEECNIVVFDGAEVETGTLTTVLVGITLACVVVAVVVVTAAFIEAIAIAICFSSNLIGVIVLVDVITVDGI